MRTIPYLHDFISELPDHIKEDISRLSTERTLSRGDAAYRKGDPPGEVFRLLEGAVKLCNYSLDGREMIAGEFRPGDCFGEMGVIDGLPRVSNAIASRDSRLGVISKQDFDALRRKHPEINAQLNLVLCRRVRFLYSLYDESFGLKLNVRLARVLHRLAYSHGIQGHAGEIYIEISHQDLSHMLGASRQSISKELKLLEHEGDIQLRYSKIYFRDLALLAEKCEQAVGMEQFAPIYDEGD
ncbi:MAG: Crp/Fnr family transcriptional regulator [Pseudomonadales bacterium]|nr:Crp/Fnr family transcriptional regulator [Pseudomonadales bacterium]